MTIFLTPKNNSYSTLAAGIDNAVTSFDVAAGEGARFPSTYPFHITIDSEILSCTDRSTDTFTVATRGTIEGTSAAAHLADAIVRLNITAQAISDLNTAVNLRLVITDIDDSPVDAETAAPISSNWAYDHAALATAHGLVAATDPGGAALLHVMASVNGATAWSVQDIFDATVPETQAIADSASAGTAVTASHRDHKHAMPSAATMNTASVAAVAAAGVTLATTKNIAFTSPGALVIPTLATTLADGEWVGITCPGVIGTAAGQIFGDLCYFNPATNEWLLTDADAVATALGTLGICLAAGAENAASTYLLWGRVRADAAFPALTALTTTYMSGTVGDITETAPTGSIGIIRCVGFSVNANEIFFQPSTDYYTLVA